MHMPLHMSQSGRHTRFYIYMYPPRDGKHVIAATQTHPATEKTSEVSFSMQTLSVKGKYEINSFQKFLQEQKLLLVNELRAAISICAQSGKPISLRNLMDYRLGPVLLRALQTLA
jgi:hypothetical protein